MPPEKYYRRINYNVPTYDGFITLSPEQLVALYNPGVDIVEQLLEFSDYKEANDLIARIK